jgi:aminotransferase
MDQSRFIAKHVVNLPKSGIRDFFDIVAKLKDAISLGGAFLKPIATRHHLH